MAQLQYGKTANVLSWYNCLVNAEWLLMQQTLITCLPTQLHPRKKLRRDYMYSLQLSLLTVSCTVETAITDGLSSTVGTCWQELHCEVVLHQADIRG